jgi:hypothetical protein
LLNLLGRKGECRDMFYDVTWSGRANESGRTETIIKELKELKSISDLPEGMTLPAPQFGLACRVEER